MTTIMKVKIEVKEVPSMEEMVNLFNNVQGCLNMGHDDGLFTLDEKMNIECVLPINKAFNTVSNLQLDPKKEV